MTFQTFCVYKLSLESKNNLKTPSNARAYKCDYFLCVPSPFEYIFLLIRAENGLHYDIWIIWGSQKRSNFIFTPQKILYTSGFELPIISSVQSLSCYNLEIEAQMTSKAKFFPTRPTGATTPALKCIFGGAVSGCKCSPAVHEITNEVWYLPKKFWIVYDQGISNNRPTVAINRNFDLIVNQSKTGFLRVENSINRHKDY